MPGPPESSPSVNQERVRVVDDTLLLNVVTSFFKKAAVVLAVWVTGYYKFSPSWLLLGLVLYVWKERHVAARRHGIAISQQIARDERGAILARVEDLPSWVFFPDVERAEWLNKMIYQMWPYIGEYIMKMLRESIEPKVRTSLPATLSSFRFTTIDLGDIPPRVGGIKVYTTTVRRDEVYMDLEINYASDSNIVVQLKGMSAGIKDFNLRGVMRVIFRPLISKMPLIGGVNLFFLNNPDIDFNLTNLANALDLPGLSDLLHTIIREQVANIMVLPNRIPIQLASKVDLRKLTYPLPQGVVRVHIVEAKELIKADISILGQGKSDPYVVLTVGAQEFKTKVINNTLQPVWNEVFEFIVDERDGQFLKLDVFDKDPNKDDPLGKASVDISTIFKKGNVDEWFTLEDVKTGMVHAKVRWLYLANDPLELDRQVESVMAQVAEEHLDEDSVHTALLIVNLDSAFGLPRGKKTLVEPSPMVYLTVGQNTQESTVRVNTTEPKWEENFRFLITSPYHQNLDLEIRDTKTKKTIGELSVRLKELLSAEEMFMDQRFPVRTKETGCFIYMSLILRVLTPNANPQWMEPENLLKDDGPGGEGSSVDKKDELTPPSGGDSKPLSSVSAAPENIGKQNGEKPVNKEEVVMLSSSPSAVDMEVRQRKPNSPTLPVTQSIEGNGQFGLGRIQLTLRYSTHRQILVIVIHKISNLKPAQGDSKGLADPYVRMYLLPDRDTKSKRKTKVVKDNLNPVFDETYEYPVSPPELNNRSLELTVKNETGMFSSSQTQMGMVLIDLSTLDTSRAVTQWFDLAPENSIKASSLESEV